MYYEESVIDGVLHIRTTPDGEWRKLSAEEITLKYMEEKHKVSNLSGYRRVRVSECDHRTPRVSCDFCNPIEG